MPASIAADALGTFPDRNARAHQAADKILAALDPGGRIKVRRNPHAFNIVMLHLSKDEAAALSLRARRAGIGVEPWEDGAMPFFVSATILRRPAAELSSALLG